MQFYCDDLAAAGNEAFDARAAGKPLAAYAGDRQISDVKIVSDRVAYVRVDKPSRPVLTVFLFFRLGREWKIVDKAWSNPED